MATRSPPRAVARRRTPSDSATAPVKPELCVLDKDDIVAPKPKRCVSPIPDTIDPVPGSPHAVDGDEDHPPETSPASVREASTSKSLWQETAAHSYLAKQEIHAILFQEFSRSGTSVGGGRSHRFESDGHVGEDDGDSDRDRSDVEEDGADDDNEGDVDDNGSLDSDAVAGHGSGDAAGGDEDDLDGDWQEEFAMFTLDGLPERSSSSPSPEAEHRCSSAGIPRSPNRRSPRPQATHHYDASTSSTSASATPFSPPLRANNPVIMDSLFVELRERNRPRAVDALYYTVTRMSRRVSYPPSPQSLAY